MPDADIWKDEELFFSGDEFFKDQLKRIDAARTSIELESYIFENDEVGQKYEEALLAATKRGVKVRMLVDGFGSLEWINLRAHDLIKQGLNVRIFNPLLLFRRMMKQQNQEADSLTRFSEVATSLNRRNHRKCCIVDGTTAWVGSMNITRVHTSEFTENKGWRDTGVRVSGDISALQIGFDYIWKMAKDPDVRKIWRPGFFYQNHHDSLLVRSNYTSLMRRRGYNDFMGRIEKAEKRIYITTAYLAPSLKFIKALGRAAHRGVEVKVLLPRVSDVVFMPWIARSFYKELLAGGVDIYEFLPCVLHAKTVVIDEWAMVGSTNLNGRSFQRDLEVDIVLSHTETVKKLCDKFHEDLRHSEKIKDSEEDFTSALGRWMLRTFRNWV